MRPAENKGAPFREGRDFGGAFRDKYFRESAFKFKNSLILTPNYEAEFSTGGGVRYIRSFDNEILFMQEGIFVTYNGILKLPVMEKREIKRQSDRQRLVIEEKYNFEETFAIKQETVLFYGEPRVDLLVTAEKVFRAASKAADRQYTLTLHLIAPEIGETARWRGAGVPEGEYVAFLTREGARLEGASEVSLEYGRSDMLLYPEGGYDIYIKKMDLKLTAARMGPGKTRINCRICFKPK